MTAVEDFIWQKTEAQRGMMLYLRSMILNAADHITERIRYQTPFFDGRSWLCYFNVPQNGSVELGFPRGNELSNEQGLLEAKGRAQVRTIAFGSLTDIIAHENALREIIQEVILLDQTTPYSSKRTKKL